MIGGASLRRGLIALWCLVAAGCGEVTNEPTEEAIATAGPAAATTISSVADDATTPEPASTSEPASSARVAELAGSTENPIDEPPGATGPEPELPLASTADVPAGASDLAVVAPAEPAIQEFAPAAPATQEFEAAPGLTPSSVARSTSAETLDFLSLVTRLRKTKAISLLTKVAVKNESDDLLEKFRAYHAQQEIATLGDLRRSYDLLFHKLHSLLRDADPPLARDIDRSRAAIWDFLADPRKFGTSHLMAGA